MTKRVILPAEAEWEMLIRGRDAMIERIEDDDIDLSTDDASACYAAMIDASPNAGKVAEADLNALAAAIKKASSERRYGKYDYSEYPGKEPPFVVRDERTGDAVFRSWSCDEVEREYARLCDEHIARTAVSALGLEVE